MGTFLISKRIFSFFLISEKTRFLNMFCSLGAYSSQNFMPLPLESTLIRNAAYSILFLVLHIDYKVYSIPPLFFLAIHFLSMLSIHTLHPSIDLDLALDLYQYNTYFFTPKKKKCVAHTLKNKKIMFPY